MRTRLIAIVAAAAMSSGVALGAAPASASSQVRFGKLVAEQTVTIHLKSAERPAISVPELCAWKLYAPTQFGNPRTYKPEGPGSLVEGSLVLDCTPYIIERMYLDVVVQQALPGTDPTVAHADDGWVNLPDSLRDHYFDGNDNIIHGTHVCTGDQLWAYRTRGTADVLYDGIWYQAGTLWLNGLARKYFC